MTLLFNTSGRPQVVCINPTCKKIHAIHRRGDYVKRSSVYVKCRACGTKWHLQPHEVETLKTHYEKRQAELEEKKLMKEEKQENKVEKPFQEKTVKEPEKPKKDKPKKSWLDGFLD